MSSKIRVGLIFGGRSGEHEVSLASATSIFNALDKSKYDVVLIGIDKTGRWLLPEESLLLAHQANPMKVQLGSIEGSVSLVPYSSSSQIVPSTAGQRLPSLQKLDVILPILHGTYGEDGTIQGLLEMANIPFVGSGVLGSSVGMDKDVARRLLRGAGIPVVPTMVLRKADFFAAPKKAMTEVLEKFSLPFFVKPANAGSSVGVFKVKSREQLESSLRGAFEYDLKVLVEKGVEARELECSVLGNAHPKASTVGEVIPHHEFYSYEAKYLDENGASIEIPAKGLDGELVKKIQELSILAFKALELRGLARVDFLLDKKTNELYLNEVNTIPGFTKISMYPKMWEASGLPYSKLLDELIHLALEYNQEKCQLKTSFSTE